MYNKIQDYLVRAKKYINQGERNEAIVCIKEALAIDPNEMLITEVLLSFERNFNSKPSINKKQMPKVERNNTKPMDAKLEKILNLSKNAKDAGDDVKAIAYLKKAKQLFPDNIEVQEKLLTLKTTVGASNLVLIGLKALDKGNIQKAVKAARKAFNLDPNTDKLQELVVNLEKLSENNTTIIKKPVKPIETAKRQVVRNNSNNYNASPQKTVNKKTEPTGSEALLWADRIRRAVQDDKFEEAGKMVSEAIRKFPKDDLLNSFYSKLKRLGFTK